jgi:ribosomal protein S18 acetylase RimI-like enzyme
MIVRDWRDADRDLLQPLYDRGQQGWLATLGWDTSNTLREVEHARTTWGLPGLLASDESGIRGWTFFLPEDNILHVGGLAADTPRATSSLLDALVELSEAHGAEALSCFMLDEAPELSSGLTTRGFDVEPFLYLARTIEPRSASSRETSAGAMPWQAADTDDVAMLLRDAYGADAGRHFAPRHTPAEWQRYVRNLVEQTACGELNTDATRVVRSGGRLEAVVIATSLSPTTAHLAQVVVHPSRRGAGLARTLVEDACAIAHRQGHRLATLLVGASNTAARRLYAGLGFTERATFVAASRRN